MEDTLGLDIKSLNKYLNDYISALRSTGKFTLANSVWIRNDEDRIKVEKEFLQTLADYYGAQAFKSDFNEETVKAINGWISDNTDGMIKNMLEKIEVDNVMFLINALTFESEWADTEWSNIQPGKFTTEAGIELDAVMMGYDGEFNYIIDTEGGAKGIEKEYTGGQYSFVALLPDEGKSLSDYTASLTGERFVSLVKSAKKTNGIYQIPKFSFDYSVTLNDILSDMGMGGAFDSNGDFSKMASTDSEALYISNVIHNTFIKVDEKGTIAGAATIVSMSDECAPETVINLNRPFLFAIVDNSTGLPLFIGAVYQV